MPTLYSFAETDVLSQRLATFVAQASAQSIQKHGKFTIALSGGSLPKTLAKYLVHDSSVEWSKWHVFFADERCVPLDHPDSNYLLCFNEIFSKVPIPENQINHIDTSLLPNPWPKDDEEKTDAHPSNTAASEIADAYEQTLIRTFAPASTVKLPQFDLICLGTGPDGHTASLFPSHELLNESDSWVSFLTDSPKPPTGRITLTLPVLTHAARIAFVATGSSKTEILKTILDHPEDGLPASLVGMGAGEKVTWWVDDAACGSTNFPRKEFRL